MTKPAASSLMATTLAVVAMLWLGTIRTYAAATLLPNGEQCFQSTSPTSGGLYGPLVSLGTITGGSGYPNNVYTNVPLTGGSGFGATANITVSGGSVVNVTIVNPGTHYAPADVLSAATANLGGAGSAFSVPVASVSTTGTGLLGLLGAITGGSGGAAGTYPGVALTGGSGSGAAANITVAGGAVTAVAITAPGLQYQVGDILSAASGSIGGTTGFSVPVSSVVVNSALAGGRVFMYVPNTVTFKQTWKNAAQTILNTNPITLDQNGCAIIYGTGTYRQVLQDSIGNTVWDQLTTDTSAQQNVFWAGLAGGTPNAITLIDPGFNATDGSIINFTALSTNTGATTINPSSFGNISLVKDTATGPQTLVGGEIVAGNPISVIYRIVDNSFHILNPIVPFNTGNQVANLLGYCVIDGGTFAATIAGIQNAINTSTCHDIYIPAGTYPGTNTLTIARSNLKLHGAGGITTPQGVTSGTTASTILSFSCFGGILAPAFVVGNSNPAIAYGGIDISDLEILLPTACNMIGFRVMASTPDSGNMMRRVRVTETSGNTVGAGIWLDQLVYSWRFEDVIVDHFFDGYHFTGQNHFTQIVGGQVRNNQVGFNHQSTTASSNIIVNNVDIEGNTAFAIDIFNASGFTIRDNFIDNGFSSATIGVRISANSSFTVEGVVIEGNYFNNGGSALYAIDIEAGGFNGLAIIGNHFNSYMTADILNSATASKAQKGSIISNDKFGTQPESTAYTGFLLNDSASNRNFTVSQLPTCNLQIQGARYFVIDQNTAIAYHGSVTGGGTIAQAVNCDGTNWYQD